jgi:cell division septation protein DedD
MRMYGRERATRAVAAVRGAVLWPLACACLIVGTPGATRPLVAQGTAVDNAVARARALVEGGNGRAGRLVLDSMVQDAGMSTPALGELLYWRGLLAESSSEAERDWRRLLLEVPMSPRAEDALLRLAQLEQLRGRPAASRVLLERLVREYREPGSQARAHFWLAKAWFDENDRPRACGALEVVQRNAPTSAVELRMQSDDLRTRCRGVTAMAPVSAAAVAAAPVAPPPVAAPASNAAAVRDSIERDSVQRASAQRETAQREAAQRDAAQREAMEREQAQRDAALRDSLARVAAARPATTPPAATTPAPAAASGTTRPANARYSVQLSALNTLAQAEQFAQRFRARGVDARVDGTSAPFRVRTGYFTTRAQATARLAELKQLGLDGFVAELTP